MKRKSDGESVELAQQEEKDDEYKTKIKSLPQRTEMHPKRKFFHALNGLLYASVYVLVDGKLGLVLFLPLIIFCVLLELARLNFPAIAKIVFLFFGPFMRSHELHRPSGICYYVSGVLLSAIFFDKFVVLLAIVYLALGDPLASAVGILTRENLPKLWSATTFPPNRKSLVGTFVSSIFLSVLSFLILSKYVRVLEDLHWTEQQLLIVSVVGGVSGALSELLLVGPMITFLDDNFTIPLLSGAAIQATLFALGLSLSSTECVHLAPIYYWNDALALVSSYISA